MPKVVVHSRMKVNCQVRQEPEQSNSPRQQQYSFIGLDVFWYSILALVLQTFTPTAVVLRLSQARVIPGIPLAVSLSSQAHFMRFLITRKFMISVLVIVISETPQFCSKSDFSPLQRGSVLGVYIQQEQPMFAPISRSSRARF